MIEQAFFFMGAIILLLKLTGIVLGISTILYGCNRINQFIQNIQRNWGKQICQ